MIEIVPDYLNGWRLVYENDVQVVTTSTLKVSCNTDMLNFNASSGLETSDGVERSMLNVKGVQNERKTKGKEI